MAELGRYVYAVLPDVPDHLLGTMAGLDGASVRPIAHRELIALVSDVDLDEYGEDGLRRNLEDLRWLESTARTHDAVVQAAFAAGPVAPMRLATIFHDDDGVRSQIDDRYDDLRAALDRVAGRVEWSVKVLAPTRMLEPAAAAPPASGAEYLRRKKNDSLARQRTDTEAIAAARRLEQAISASVLALRQLQPQDARLSGLEGTMLLNLAVLVDDEASARWAAEIDDLVAAEPSVTVVLAGPWPPYSFATLEP